MSSSESDDDMFTNIAVKLNKLKNHYADDNSPLEFQITKKNEEESSLKSPDTSTKKRKAQTRLKGQKKNTPANDITVDATTPTDTGSSVVAADLPAVTNPRRTRKNRGGNTTSPSIPPITDADSSLVTNSRRKTRSGRGGNTASPRIPAATGAPASWSRTIRGRAVRPGRYQRSVNPIAFVNIGNTHEYPDESEQQELFSNKQNSDVLIVEDYEVSDNEEMSVKVYWQSYEIFKFLIRKYQKLCHIYDHFALKEGVSKSRLLFTYNDKIISPEDTPSSINYSIAKCIEGGIVSNPISVSNTQNEVQIIPDGVQVKFQCQNIKKPFVTYLKPSDKFCLSMTKCAEYFEKPIDRLKFYFDGDVLTSGCTPDSLDFEGGECIDVKFI